LYYELYFLPMPPPGADGRPPGEFLEWLLKHNRSLFTVHFALGRDGDVYLVGRVPIQDLDETRLDHVIGEIYEATETWFQPAVKMAFGRP
ncbi:MAG: YbjN domain-containing protein, partial [Actinobacteria bacterium]|nr:YbjN domain-containing protein [Actinomycetota bacterium]